VVWATFVIFFCTIQMTSCRDWWQWTKPGYITMTRRQSNNQWSGGISAHPAPKMFRVQKSAGRVLASKFWDQERILLIDYLPKGQTINAEYYSSLLLQLNDFWRKNAVGRSSKESWFCTTMPQLAGHLQPRRNCPTWDSSVLITHPILRIWPRRTATCSLDWNKQSKVRHFSSEAKVIVATETWLDGQLSEFFFLSGLQMLEQRAKNCIELRGEYVE
jgi:hypothetical protein